LWVSPQIVDSSLSNQKTSSEIKKSHLPSNKKVFRKIMWSLSSAFFARIFASVFPPPLQVFLCKVCTMYALRKFIFCFLIVMSKIVIKKKRKQPYPRCLSKLSFILTKKKKLKSLSIRRIVFHNIQEIESFLHFPLCGWRSGKSGKLQNDVFRFLNSLSEEITSLSLIQEVFQEKSFIILIVCKFSMESLIIRHEIHKNKIVVQMLG